MASELPVALEADAIRLGARVFRGRGVGIKLIHPNPLAPERYVILQLAPTAAGVEGGNQLPDFLPDYVVYDAATTGSRPRLNFDRVHRPLAMGYFDGQWKLPDVTAASPQPIAPVNSATGAAPTPATDVVLTNNSPTAAPAEATAEVLDPAAIAAERIVKLVATFPNYRVQVRPATWVTHAGARWSIRSEAECLRALEALRVPARSVNPRLKTPVPSPVEVLGPVEGVTFRMTHADRTLLMSCEMAARLPAIAKILARHDVHAVDVISTYRDRPFCSFHTFGFALDLARFYTSTGVLHVAGDFEKTPKHETCKAPESKRPRARALRDIACALGESLGFSSVLTPNYNAGHHDHFHLDIRPDDDRVFVR
jgi:hypothetical protein